MIVLIWQMITVDNQFIKQMERSFIQNIEGMGSSSFFVNGSACITTSESEGALGLKRSQIQNLPSYSKVDLSSKKDFVLIFQSMQVQRLSLQVESLRVKLKDLQRQLINNESYDVQIKELTERIHNYEIQRQQYKEQLQKMNFICQKLSIELQNINQSKFNEVSNRQQITYYENKASKLTQENYRLQEQLRKIQQKYYKLDNQFQQYKSIGSRIQINQAKNRQIQAFNTRFNEQIKIKENEIEDWKTKYLYLERNINNYKIVEKQKKSLEEQLTFQIRINDDNQRKIRYLEQATSHVHQLENQLRNGQLRRQQSERLQSSLDIKNIECQNLRRKLKETESNAVRSLQNQLSENKSKSSYISQEIDRINHIVNQKSHEIKMLKQEFRKYFSKTAHLAEVQNKIKDYIHTLKQLNQRLDQAHRHNNDLQEGMNKFKNQSSEAKNQLHLALEEKDRLQNILNQKNLQIEVVKKQLIEKNTEIKVSRAHQTKYLELQNKIKVLQENHSEVEARYKRQYYRAEDLNRIVSNLKSEVERMKKDGYFPSSFVNQLSSMRKYCEQKDKDINTLELKILSMEQILKMLKSQTDKNNGMNKRNYSNWKKMSESISIYSELMKKLIQMQSEITRVSEENINLESQARLMSFQLNQSLSKSIIHPSSTEYSEYNNPSFVGNSQFDHHNHDKHHYNNFNLSAVQSSIHFRLG